jgi:hypothetical protein
VANLQTGFLNGVEVTYKITNETKLINARFDANGTIFNGTIKSAQLSNLTYFNAEIVNYNITNLEILYTPEPEQKPTIDLVPMAEKMNEWLINPWFWAGVTLFLFVAFRSYYHMMHQPYIWVRKHENLKDYNIGRFIKEDPIPSASLWKYVVKDYNGLHAIYSDRSFSEYAPFNFAKIMQIFHYYPDLVFMYIDVPSDVVIQSRKLSKTLKNTLLKIPYAICSLLSLINFTQKIWSKFDLEGGREEKIPFLMNIHMMEQMDLHFDIEYEKFELDLKDGTEKWIPKKQEKLPMSEVLAILKNKSDNPVENKIQNFRYIAIHNDQIKYSTIHECIKDIRTKLMDRAYFESRKMFYERAVQSTYELYKKNSEELTTLKLTEEERFHAMFSKIDAINTDRNNSLPELISLYTRYRQLGLDEQESLKKCILDKIDKEYGQEAKQLQRENAELKAKISMFQSLLKKKLKSLENNEINVRNEYEVNITEDLDENE